MTEFKVEERKFYKSSDGRKVGPMHLGCGSKLAWVVGRASAYDAEWDFDGRVVMAGPEKYGDLIAEWKDEPTGPVTIETVKRINSGTFWRVSVGQTNPIGAAKATSVLVGVTAKSGGSSFNVDMDASELRAAADVFIQLADALEGK